MPHITTAWHEVELQYRFKYFARIPLFPFFSSLFSKHIQPKTQPLSYTAFAIIGLPTAPIDHHNGMHTINSASLPRAWTKALLSSYGSTTELRLEIFEFVLTDGVILHDVKLQEHTVMSVVMLTSLPYFNSHVGSRSIITLSRWSAGTICPEHGDVACGEIKEDAGQLSSSTLRQGRKVCC